MKMENLINGDLLKPISDLGISLLDKVEKATGWIFSTTTVKKEGYKNIIEEISKRDDINPFDRVALISNFNKIKKVCVIAVTHTSYIYVSYDL